MRTFIYASTASLLLAVASFGSASAQITPNATTVSIGGTVLLQQSTPINCNFAMTIDVDAGGMSGRVTSFNLSPGDPGCVIVTPHSFPWELSSVSSPTKTFKIDSVHAGSLFGNCDEDSPGVITVSWPQPSPSGVVSFTSNGFTIDGEVGGVYTPCLVLGEGVVTASTGGLPVSVN